MWLSRTGSHHLLPDTIINTTPAREHSCVANTVCQLWDDQNTAHTKQNYSRIKKDATHEKHEMDTSGSFGQTNGENVFSETTSCCVCDLWATPWCPLTTAGAYMHPNTYTPRMITEINVPKMYIVYQEYERRLKSSTSIHSANRTTWPLLSATWINSFHLLSRRRKHQLELNPLATALRLQQRVCRLFKFSSGEASVKDSVWRCHCQD